MKTNCEIRLALASFVCKLAWDRAFPETLCRIGANSDQKIPCLLVCRQWPCLVLDSNSLISDQSLLGGPPNRRPRNNRNIVSLLRQISSHDPETLGAIQHAPCFQSQSWSHVVSPKIWWHMVAKCRALYTCSTAICWNSHSSQKDGFSHGRWAGCSFLLRSPLCPELVKPWWNLPWYTLDLVSLTWHNLKVG